MKAKLLIPLAALALLVVSCADNQSNKIENGYSDREALETIFSRKSVRVYSDKAVEDHKVELMVKAAMAAPSGMDKRPWEIIVVNDKEILESMGSQLKNAPMIAKAPLAFIICGDVQKSAYWYLDCSAATQNLLLAAEALGLGGVWTASYPYEDRMQVVIDAIGLPENILPLAVIPVGYPGGTEKAKDKYDASKVRYNAW